MNNEELNKNLSLFSLILRLALGSLFLGAAIIKVQGGIDGNIAYYMGIFEKSIFPTFLVKIHGSIIMFVEFILGLWLVSGFKLKQAWIASATTLISLAFGMIFVYKFDVVSDNLIYVVMSCVGILIAPYDKYRFLK
jgi:thiosulfate dehydrogenase [quinone] large subunit